MNAQELRIGNWLKMIDGTYFQVSSIDFSNIEAIPQYLHPKPIHLTPEILEKAGFEKVLNGEYYSHKKLGEKITLYLPLLNLDYYVGNIKIEYLHQLQNLYFALTGEELEIKL